LNFVTMPTAVLAAHIPDTSTHYPRRAMQDAMGFLFALFFLSPAGHISCLLSRHLQASLALPSNNALRLRLLSAKAKQVAMH
jgi:hypothetical protein